MTVDAGTRKSVESEKRGFVESLNRKNGKALMRKKHEYLKAGNRLNEESRMRKSVDAKIGVQYSNL